MWSAWSPSRWSATAGSTWWPTAPASSATGPSRRPTRPNGTASWRSTSRGSSWSARRPSPSCGGAAAVRSSTSPRCRRSRPRPGSRPIRPAKARSTPLPARWPSTTPATASASPRSAPARSTPRCCAGPPTSSAATGPPPTWSPTGAACTPLAGSPPPPRSPSWSPSSPAPAPPSSPAPPTWSTAASSPVSRWLCRTAEPGRAWSSRRPCPAALPAGSGALLEGVAGAAVVLEQRPPAEGHLGRRSWEADPAVAQLLVGPLDVVAGEHHRRVRHRLGDFWAGFAGLAQCQHQGHGLVRWGDLDPALVAVGFVGREREAHALGPEPLGAFLFVHGHDDLADPLDHGGLLAAVWPRSRRSWRLAVTQP